MVSWGVKSAIFSIKFRRQKLRARRDERFVTGLIGTLSEMKPDSWEIFKFMQKLGFVGKMNEANRFPVLKTRANSFRM